MAKRSLHERQGHAEMMARLSSLRPDSRRQWGTMDVAQMLAHCQAAMHVALGELQLKRGLAGILFGGMARRKLLAPEPWGHGMPTAPEFRIHEARDFTREHEAMLELLRRFGRGGPAALSKQPHPFFGKLTVEQWDTLQWRHLDHHLRQFGV